MTILPASMRSRIQASLNRWLNETCDIYSDEVTFDASGGQVVTAIPVALAVPCRFIDATQSDMVMAGMVGSQESIGEIYKVPMPAGTPLIASQRVVRTGLSYTVIALIVSRTDAIDAQVLVRRQN